jgi:hypothetical protein
LERLLRAMLAITAAGATIAGAWACGSHDDAAPVTQDDVSTYGAEVVVTVLGSGRVTSTEGTLSCPPACFTRILLKDPSADGAAAGVPIVAAASLGWHFDRWKLDTVDLGIRGRGPAECSPVTRTTEMVPLDGSQTVHLPYGEVKGTAPRGHEAECADFTSVPVAYALTAMFKQDPVAPGVDATAPQNEVLFERVPDSISATDIGVTSGRVYWRFVEGNGTSGIATGPSTGGSLGVINKDQQITAFHVDKHVAFQLSNNEVHLIEGGQIVSRMLGNFGLPCTLATDTFKIYCRFATGGVSNVYASPIDTAAFAFLFSLPRGSGMAVDDATQRLFFSDDTNSAMTNSTVASTPLAVDGGTPIVTTLVDGQMSPRDMVIGPSSVFWLDARGGGVQSATSGAKLAPSTGIVSISAPSVRFIAADAFSNDYWIGISNDAESGISSILRATAGKVATTTFRTNLPGLNGLAVDSTYVYWTQDDGRVYRALKAPQL